MPGRVMPGRVDRPAMSGHDAGMRLHPSLKCALAPVLAALMLLAPAARAQERAPDIVSEVRQEGDFIRVSASAEVAVPRALAFSVLTDYEHFPEFIPDLEHSRIALRQGTGLILEQRGMMKFLFFSQPIDVRLAIIESAPERVVSHSLAGTLRGFSGRYELHEVPGGVRIDYSARFIPAFVLPEFLGTFIVRNVFVKHFAATLKEMQRRRAAAPPERPAAAAAATAGAN